MKTELGFSPRIRAFHINHILELPPCLYGSENKGVIKGYDMIITLRDPELVQDPSSDQLMFCPEGPRILRTKLSSGAKLKYMNCISSKSPPLFSDPYKQGGISRIWYDVELLIPDVGRGLGHQDLSLLHSHQLSFCADIRGSTLVQALRHVGSDPQIENGSSNPESE